jgi:hypothetical protein
MAPSGIESLSAARGWGAARPRNSVIKYVRSGQLTTGRLLVETGSEDSASSAGEATGLAAALEPAGFLGSVATEADFWKRIDTPPSTGSTA